MRLVSPLRSEPLLGLKVRHAVAPNGLWSAVGRWMTAVDGHGPWWMPLVVTDDAVCRWVTFSVVEAKLVVVPKH